MKLFQILFLFSPLLAFAGSKTIIDRGPSGAKGTLDVSCQVARKVTLAIHDTGANTLVDNSGVNFGTVDADGTSDKIPGTVVGNKAQYVADLIFDANRTGTGSVTVTADRIGSGTFHPTDGLLIEDAKGSLQYLPSSGTSVSVISNEPEGRFARKFGITVHSGDSGAMSSQVQFTMSAL